MRTSLCSPTHCSPTQSRWAGGTARSTRSGRRAPRGGFTLLEIMVATAVTLLMMISLVQVFKIIGDSMKQGRAALGMNSTLRAATFRLRTDLGNLTVRVDPPANSATGAGYFEYTDGSMTDYTAALFDRNNFTDSKLPTQVIRSSRFGDVDDILMFTARASAGSWFTGRAPANVVNPSSASTNAVTIASQLAEIVVFARPVRSNVTGGLFDDVDGNYLPDSYHLYYRTLLIRPDLNQLFNGQMCLQNRQIAAGPAAPLDMAPLYQDCDISMRRLFDGSSNTVDYAAANSLEDLMDPANRFAHFQFRIPVSNSTTMPLLILDPVPQSGSVGSAITVFSSTNTPSAPLYPDLNPDPNSTGLFYRGNFLHRSFVLSGTRQGEDILMNNVMAFDVKAFDVGAPVIGVLGPDGIANGKTAYTGEDGTDDLVLTPNDPGYAPAFASTHTILYRGAYVDLLWGRKALSSLGAYSMNFQSIRTGVVDTTVTPNRLRFQSELSGIDGVNPVTANAPDLTYSSGLLRSGKLVVASGLPHVQATYDTWTTKYESDGRLQAAFGNPLTNGVVDVDNLNRMNNLTGSSNVNNALPVYRRTAIDAGTDGIDNNSAGGVDEMEERETLPPFPVKLPGIKISIRAEDQGTRQVRQMSVITEFVTQ